ncbi:carbohydrate esterase family 16 protein [Rhizoctonia solani]|uniref:Carbohydrate esterase family 16 protein n=1 Tax=Rhizoctonia solani TaxID=456999 RepID=A0A8H8NYG8_9AGAM|nr:carbohydrate esterase family 16 protein [Rhizoctonia solani]QRW20985.1 carbohydrate esterase family 16 protein [Rhizoctonia solani]
MHSALSLLLLASSSLGSAKKHTIKHKHTHRGTEPPLGDMLLATAGSYVTDIAKCPPLKPRDSPPTSVHDLRPDDFSVAMAIGDSITAGAFAKGKSTLIPKAKT